MSAPTELHISKLDAAKRQLEVAIRLYFAWGDPVAIHTLAAAAINLLKQQLTALRTQKRGLMQKLLTGQWRLPVQEETS
jgi:hypothetical protein